MERPDAPNEPEQAEPASNDPIRWQRTILWAVGIAAVLWAVSAPIRSVITQNAPRATDQPDYLTSIPFALIAGLGLAVLLSLTLRLRGRIWSPSRRKAGRWIGAILLTGLTPTIIFGWVPSILGFWLWLSGAMVLLEGGSLHTLIFLLQTCAVFAVAMAIWYLISNLLITGVKSRAFRFALFCLMFWTAYSLNVLFLGVRQFLPL